MATRILYNADGLQCLYDSVTERVFGVLFHADEDAQDFIDWLPNDPRVYRQADLESLIHRWSAEQEAQSIG